MLSTRAMRGVGFAPTHGPLLDTVETFRLYPLTSWLSSRVCLSKLSSNSHFISIDSGISPKAMCRIRTCFPQTLFMARCVQDIQILDYVVVPAHVQHLYKVFQWGIEPHNARMMVACVF